jgi:amino acid permease
MRFNVRFNLKALLSKSGVKYTAYGLIFTSLFTYLLVIGKLDPVAYTSLITLFLPSLFMEDSDDSKNKDDSSI